MNTAVVAITKNGAELAVKIGSKLDADIYVKNEFVEKYILKDEMFFIHPVTTDFSAFVGKLFGTYEAIVFVMACGIVVRTIAPHLQDKVNDPAVVVVDENGQHAISLLSGHIGGANELAKNVASITDGTPVITTATDVNGVLSFDVFAVENDCVIENIKDLKYISAQLVNGGKVGFYSDYRLNGRLPDNVLPYCPDSMYMPVAALTNRNNVKINAQKVLFIRPRNLILGIGCKKGTPGSRISEAVHDFMQKNGKSILSLKFAASIDLKKDEKGILDFCNEYKLEFKTISAEVIKTIESRFTFSSFVKEKTGVGGVAEACAVVAGNNARLICPKIVYGGITLALAEEEKAFYL